MAQCPLFYSYALFQVRLFADELASFSNFSRLEFIHFLMALTFKDIERVANLARLELRPDETEHTLSQLNGFFALVEQMEAVDTEGVEPLAHPTALLGEVALRLRDDIASEPDQREASQVSAPAVERGLFLVPKVIE
jgi:aspartyl-tRNA(Asn)/glutamyl-tRNA(Gln) amidotransferase subunit C